MNTSWASGWLQSKFLLWKRLNVDDFVTKHWLLDSVQRRRRFGYPPWCIDLFKQHHADKFSHTESYGHVAAVTVKFRKGKSEGDHFITQEILIYAFMPLIQRRKMDTQSGMILNYWKRCLIDHSCRWSGKSSSPQHNRARGHCHEVWHVIRDHWFLAPLL